MTAVDDCEVLLDETEAALNSRTEIVDAMSRLYWGLRSIRAQSSNAEWKSIVGRCRAHSLLHVLHQDPFTMRAFSKPRGYPGDAGLIDYLYKAAPRADERSRLSCLGGLLLDINTNTLSGFAVRERKRVAAREIDRAARCNRDATIVAIAAGHAREIAASNAMQSKSVARFLAIDQDPSSLDVIRSDYASLGVYCVESSVQALLFGQKPVHAADMIYALGLYDYLADRVAHRLTAAIFSMLAPGGTMLIANFTPGIAEAAFMEAFGDWFLIYRSPQQLLSLTSSLPDDRIASRDLWTDDLGCVAYMRIARADDA